MSAGATDPARAAAATRPLGPDDAAPVLPDAAARKAAEAKKATAAKRRKAGRLQELDAIRALMFLVVTFHAYQASGGETSQYALRDFSTAGMLVGNIDVLLPVFFLLSGFAIYYQMVGALLLGRPLPPSVAFLVARALRLLPVYMVVFLVVWFWRYGGGSAQWLDVLWGLTLMQSWSTEHIFRTIDPGWYLSVEWQFAVFTALAILPWLRLVGRWPLRSRLVGVLVPPLALIGLTIWWKSSLHAHAVPRTEWGSWFAPPAWAALYGLGMLLGLALLLREPLRWRCPKPVPTLIFVIASAWLVWIQSLRGDSSFATLWYFELGALGCLGWMVAIVTADPDGRVRRFLRSPLVQLLAAASFSTYLVHAPILRSMAARDILPMDVPELWPYSTAAIVILSLVVGVLAFRWIEQPLASLDRLLQPRLRHELKIARATSATIEPGTPLPDVTVRLRDGSPFPLRTLGSRRPALLLVHPAEPVPEGDPALRGLGAALRAIDGARSAAAGLDVGLATLSPRLPPSTDAGAPPHPPGVPVDDVGQITRLEDPEARAARALGVRTVRTAVGVHQPEIVLLAVGTDGQIAAVLRDDDPHRLLRAGLEALRPPAAPARPAVAPRPSPAT